MKGKQNFPCLDLYDSRELSYEQASKDKKISCSMGNCARPQIIDGEQKTIYCTYKPNLSQFQIHNKGTERERVSEPDTESCYYYVKKYQALHASHSIYNYSSYFQTKKYSSGIDELLNKQCIIADEAHEIEEQIIGYIEVDVTLRYLQDMELDFAEFNFDDINGITEMISFLADEYHQKVKILQSTNERDLRIPTYENRRNKLDTLVYELRTNTENMICQTHKDFAGNITSISIKPINISKYTKEFFDTPYQIFMSATIQKDVFCDTMGIPASECAFVEIEQSPFPVENRRVEYYNTRYLNVRSTPSDYDEIYKTIDNILTKHKDDKGLILTTTKKHCRELESQSMHRDRLSILHGDVEEQKETILKNHAETQKPSVLLSPSLWYGVDLPNDLSRFQIILKTPYPSLVDLRTKIKSQKNNTWYKYTALVKLLQGLGRSVRNEKDHCVTYMIDASSQRLITSMKNYVPKSYYDSLRL
jgi:Rad3-related DNA helicase